VLVSAVVPALVAGAVSEAEGAAVLVSAVGALESG
jgi:hypothetical protein